MNELRQPIHKKCPGQFDLMESNIPTGRPIAELIARAERLTLSERRMISKSPASNEMISCAAARNAENWLSMDTRARILTAKLRYHAPLHLQKSNIH